MILIHCYSYYFIRVIKQDPIILELEWARPSEPAGDLIGYRVKYGIKNQTLKAEYIRDIHQFTFKIKDVGMYIAFWSFTQKRIE